MFVPKKLSCAANAGLNLVRDYEEVVLRSQCHERVHKLLLDLNNTAFPLNRLDDYGCRSRRDCCFERRYIISNTRCIGHEWPERIAVRRFVHDRERAVCPAM